MKKVYGYTRVSTTDQGEVSLPEQKSSIERYAMKNDLEVIQWFEEKKTAAKGGRPIFSKMMKLLQKGKAEGLVVHKIDRSTRNLRDWAELGELIDKGIDLHFSFEAIDFNTRGGRLSADIQAVIAADYIRNLRDETKKGLQGRLKQGIYPYCAPIGYLNTGGGNPKEVDPYRAELIRELFTLYASGLHSISQLENLMFEKGLRNSKGSIVTRKRISIILNNPFYMGVIKIFRTGETFQGVHKPIISKTLFDQVQIVLTGKRHKKTSKRNFTYSKCIVCGGCGKSLVAERQKGHVYYRCKDTECPIKTVREEFIEEAICQFLDLIQIKTEDIDLLKIMFREGLREISEISEIRRRAIELERSQNQERLERLTEKFVDDLIDKDMYMKTKSKWLFRQAELDDSLSELKSKELINEDQLFAFTNYLSSLRDQYFLLAPDQKRTLLKKLSPNLTYTGSKLVIEPYSPFRDIAFANSGYQCALYRPVIRTNENLLNYFSKQKTIEYELTKTEDEKFKVTHVLEGHSKFRKSEYLGFIHEAIGREVKQCHKVTEGLDVLYLVGSKVNDINV